MNLPNTLQTRIVALLRKGSIDVPGQRAVNVLASKLSAKERDVIAALHSLLTEGSVTFNGHHANSTPYIGYIGERFVPTTAEGKRQERYAVDELKNPYSSTAKGGPITTRLMTLDEWIQSGGTEETYPCRRTTDPSNNTVDPSANTKRPRSTTIQAEARRKALLDLLRDTTSKLDQQMILLSEFKLRASSEFGVSPSTIISDLRGYVTAGLIEYFKVGFHGHDYVRFCDTDGTNGDNPDTPEEELSEAADDASALVAKLTAALEAVIAQRNELQDSLGHERDKVTSLARQIDELTGERDQLRLMLVIEQHRSSSVVADDVAAKALETLRRAGVGTEGVLDAGRVDQKS